MDMRARLGLAARRARNDAGVTLARMAAETGRLESTLSMFENGHVWPDRVYDLVAIYERECGLQPDDIWRAAVDLNPRRRAE